MRTCIFPAEGTPYSNTDDERLVHSSTAMPRSYPFFPWQSNFKRLPRFVKVRHLESLRPYPRRSAIIDSGEDG